MNPILTVLNDAALFIGWVVIGIFAIGALLAIPAVWQSWPRRPFWN